MLLEAEWRSLVLRACEDNELVDQDWDNLWARTASLDTADPTGELRYRATVVLALEGIVLPDAAKDVGTSEGGGQSGQWQQHYDHIADLTDRAKAAYQAQLKTLMAVGAVIAPILTVSLTPVSPGYLDPASPAYMGDPRYFGWGTRWGRL